MKTVLVVGGAGYVGSHCCKRLAQAGYSPAVFDNLSTGHREFVKWGPLVEGDVRDRRSLAAALDDVKPIAVLHFAAHTLAGESVTNPGPYWEVNTNGTLNLLIAMRDASVGVLVFSSTCAVYGQSDAALLEESHPKVPCNPYGASKWAAEQAIEHFDHAHQLRAARLRYFNASGADPDAEIGEDHEPETHLIPVVLDAALGRRDCISIFGQDYPTEDGTAIRDYIHVQDLATAHVAALEHLLEGGASVALNLGTGQGTSVATLVSAAEDVVGHEIPKQTQARRPGDPAELVANAARAQTMLNWAPARSKLDTIISDAWRWHQRRFGAARS